MPFIKDAYTGHQLKRWTRPDAHRFVRPDWRRYVRPGYESDFLLALYEQKFRPDQSRDDRGRWTSDTNTGSDSTGKGKLDANKIAEQAQRIAAGNTTRYSDCVDLCLPYLLRIQPPGSDRNQWDFHKCLNRCLGR